MANSIWGKWTQNPSGQQEIKTCSTLREYHDCLYSSCVKRVSLISEKLLQVEMKLDCQIDRENRKRENNQSGLGGKNPIISAFVMATSRDLMYTHYLTNLCPDQLLYTDTDSVIFYIDKDMDDHLDLPTSDFFGDLNDEYEDVLQKNPSWYISELIAFGPKMYHLILHDKHSGQVINWVKTTKGISVKGNVDMFSNDKIPLYRNPVLDFCWVLQYGLSSKCSTMQEVWEAMQSLRLRRSGSHALSTISVVLTSDQTVFKCDLMYVFTDKFVVSQQTKRKVHVTQCKHFPKPDKSIPLSITFPIGWH